MSGLLVFCCFFYLWLHCRQTHNSVDKLNDIGKAEVFIWYVAVFKLTVLHGIYYHVLMPPPAALHTLVDQADGRTVY